MEISRFEAAEITEKNHNTRVSRQNLRLLRLAETNKKLLQ